MLLLFTCRFGVQWAEGNPLSRRLVRLLPLFLHLLLLLLEEPAVAHKTANILAKHVGRGRHGDDNQDKEDQCANDEMVVKMSVRLWVVLPFPNTADDVVQPHKGRHRKVADLGKK